MGSTRYAPSQYPPSTPPRVLPTSHIRYYRTRHTCCTGVTGSTKEILGVDNARVLRLTLHLTLNLRLTLHLTLNLRLTLLKVYCRRLTLLKVYCRRLTLLKILKTEAYATQDTEDGGYALLLQGSMRSGAAMQ